jgi:phosphoglycolate phosphatase-like HAD superfamily hydrolase
MGPSVVYALDFDGVLCDSVGESSQSAVRAVARIWPDLPIARSASSPPEWLLAAMRKVRPVVETGYENILLARTLLERGEGEAEGFVDSALHGDWPSDRDALMQQYGCDRDSLVEAFGSVRDDWIASDLDGWLGANRMFPGVVDALNFAAADVYIITTKDTRFAKLLLDSAGVRGMNEDKIFGLGSGTKISVLKKIIAMPECAGRKVVFVEDRYETLEAVSISMLGQPLELLLATWGYNTEKVRGTAESHPFISLLDLPTFVSKFQ